MCPTRLRLCTVHPSYTRTAKHHEAKAQRYAGEEIGSGFASAIDTVFEKTWMTQVSWRCRARSVGSLMATSRGRKGRPPASKRDRKSGKNHDGVENRNPSEIPRPPYGKREHGTGFRNKVFCTAHPKCRKDGRTPCSSTIVVIRPLEIISIRPLPPARRTDRIPRKSFSTGRKRPARPPLYPFNTHRSHSKHR